MEGPTEFGVRLRRRRRESLMNQTQAAIEMGLDQSTISQLELGKSPTPLAPTIQKLAKFLDTDFEDVARYFGITVRRTADEISTQPEGITSVNAQVLGYVSISYTTAREILNLIEAARSGPQDKQGNLNRIMFQVSRHLPDTELPRYLGGQFEEEEDEEEGESLTP